ncbi:MAG TPA: hypothetical protein DGG95_02870, partial [Cytophagales bacterium]|nr:hypothetical protein [Cytophagales bacterium]
MLTRRSFLTHSTLTLVSGSLIAGGNTTPESTFVHHVFFWLKDKQNKDDYNKLVLSLKDLKKIKQIKLLHVGSASISPLAQEASITDATYDISLLTFFENMQDKE